MAARPSSSSLSFSLAQTPSAQELQHCVRQLELLKADVDRKVERKQLELRNLLQRALCDGWGIQKRQAGKVVMARSDTRRGTYPQTAYDAANATSASEIVKLSDPPAAADPFTSSHKTEELGFNTLLSVEGKKRVQFYIASPSRCPSKNAREGDESVLCELTAPTRAVLDSAISAANIPRSQSRSIPPSEDTTEKTVPSLSRAGSPDLKQHHTLTRLSLVVDSRGPKLKNSTTTTTNATTTEPRVLPTTKLEVHAAADAYDAGAAVKHPTVSAPNRLRIVNPLVPTHSQRTTSLQSCEQKETKNDIESVDETLQEKPTVEKNLFTPKGAATSTCSQEGPCAIPSSSRITSNPDPATEPGNCSGLRLTFSSDGSSSHFRGSGESSEGVPFQISSIEPGAVARAAEGIKRQHATPTSPVKIPEPVENSEPSPEQSCTALFSIGRSRAMELCESRTSVGVASIGRCSGGRRRSGGDAPSFIASPEPTESSLSLSPLSPASNSNITPSPFSFRASDALLWEASTDQNKPQNDPVLRESFQPAAAVTTNASTSHGSPHPTELTLMKHRSSADALSSSSDAIVRAALLSLSRSSCVLEENVEVGSCENENHRRESSRSRSSESESGSKRQQRLSPRTSVKGKRKRGTDSEASSSREQSSFCRRNRSTASTQSRASSTRSHMFVDADDDCSASRKPFDALLDRIPRSKKFSGLGRLPMPGKATFTLPRSTESIPLNLVTGENEDAFTPFEAATRIWLRQWNRRQHT